MRGTIAAAICHALYGGTPEDWVGPGTGVDSAGIVRHRQVLDDARVHYLRGYIGAAAEAIREGVNLRGYFVWSLMDLCEWASGYTYPMGLVYVDHATQKRMVKDSAFWYRDLILSQGS